MLAKKVSKLAIGPILSQERDSAEDFGPPLLAALQCTSSSAFGDGFQRGNRP